MEALQQKWQSPKISVKDATWNTNCDILEEFFRQFGTCNCPRYSVCVLPDGQEVKIGQWLKSQRKQKRGTLSSSSLSAERVSRLQALVDQGKLWWNYNIIDQGDWDVMYKSLLEYGRLYGSCNVPERYKELLPNGKVLNLGKWLHRQRLSKDSTLTEDRKEKLQQLVDQGLLKWTTVIGEFNCLIAKQR